MNTEVPEVKSWWARTFGRSILGLLVGKNFSDRNVAATIIGVTLTATLCWMAIKGKDDLAAPLTNLVFAVVGFYFGSKREKGDDSDEQS